MPTAKNYTAQRPLSFTDPRETSLEWVRRTLIEQMPAADATTVGALAENLVANAEAAEVPIETLVLWIHTADRRSLATWREYCACYAAAREERRSATQG